MNKRFKNEPYIRYSNVYEEINSLLEVASGDIYLSVCSGFDNTLTLLLNNPKRIVCFDYNEAQIYLAKLKLAAFKYLSYEETLLLFGINSTKKQRLNIYKKISNQLEIDTKTYFDKFIDYIKVGLIYAGRFDYYLSLISKYIIPITQNKKVVKEFMNASSIQEQRILYQKFNNKRFKKIFNIFFSKKVMSKLGRDASFFNEIEVDLASNLKKRVDIGFNNVLNKNNPYMQYAILGKFITLPKYLEKENYEKIRKNLDKIEFYNKDFKEVITLYQYDFLNLSDIFEYMSKEQTLMCEELIINNTNKNAIIVFWNMMVQRELKNSIFKKIESENAFVKERPFFYQNLRRYVKYEDDWTIFRKC